MIDARAELRHPPGSDPAWEESWEMNFVSADGRLGGFVRLALRPHDGRAWYWAAVAGAGRPLVAVREHDVDLPRGRDLEVRASGLWAQLICETPLDHWSTGLEAFAVAMDDPTEAYRGERGDPVPLGFDLEWEATGPAGWRRPDAYAQACIVHGDVLVGAERLAFEGHGARFHQWGPRRWSSEGGASSADVLASGSIEGQVVDPGPDQPVSAHVDDRHLLVRAGWCTADGLDVTAEPLAHAPVGVPLAGGGVVPVPRALVRLTAGDGRTGAGWVSR